MAKIKDGILTGKLGGIIICNGKKGPYVRSLPKRTAPPSEAQLKNRFIFKLVQKWLQPVVDFVRLGFRGYSEQVYGMNAAISEMHRSGLVKNGFESYIDPSLVKLSQGKIGFPETMDVALDSDRKLQFSWDTDVDRSNHPRDRVMLLAYNSNLAEAAMDLSGPERYEGSATLDLSLMPLGEYHVYAAFLAASGDEQSDSRYLGVFQLAVFSVQ